MNSELERFRRMCRERLCPAIPDLPAFLFGITEFEWDGEFRGMFDHSVEHVVNPYDVGACALHMEWQEPHTVMFELDDA